MKLILNASYKLGEIKTIGEFIKFCGKNEQPVSVLGFKEIVSHFVAVQDDFQVNKSVDKIRSFLLYYVVIFYMY